MVRQIVKARITGVSVVTGGLLGRVWGWGAVVS